jgi:hypothetical protein
MNFLSAGNSFIMKIMSKFSPTLSSRSVFHVGATEICVALKYISYNIPYWSLPETENKWLMELITADNHNQTSMHELHCSPCNLIPSSGPQITSCPSFKTLSAISHTDSLAKFACTGRHEAQSRGPGIHSKNIPCIYAFMHLCIHISIHYG